MPLASRGRILVGASVALAAAAFFGLRAHHRAQPSHLLAVTPGVLYRSALLRPQNLARVIDEEGIRAIVSLLPPSSSEETTRRLAVGASIAREKGVRLVEIPMQPDTPPTPGQVDRWLALLEDEENLPILVHCKHGAVRTGMMVAVYEMEHLGKPNERALQELPRFGHDFDKPERKPVRDFILGYEPRAGPTPRGE